MDRQWRVAPPVDEELRGKYPELSPVILSLLSHRGITSQTDVDAFLNPDYERDVHDPFLFQDMRKAVDRLIRATQKRETITIHGDYDTDGVNASALLYLTLKKLGAVVDVFLPHRELDGYGLILKTMDQLAKKGTTVLITCDCGIAYPKEIARATELGIDTIITDHHSLGDELPKAHAIIHPSVPGEKYPDKGLAGGGVAFKLAQALIKEARENSPEGVSPPPVGWEKWLLDFAAISSVGDVVPLLGETRTIVKYGLIVLNKHRRLGFKKLLEASGHLDPLGLALPKIITSETIAFQISPRINAAGRMSHADDAFRLLVADSDVEAQDFANTLQDLNKERQKAVRQIVLEAKNQVVTNEQDKQPVIVTSGDNWPSGLVGLVAGRLSERFSRPAFALGKKEDGWVGSGRSIPGFDLVEAMQSMPEVFVKFGGHPQACGFTVKPDAVEDFTKKMIAYAKEKLGADTKNIKPILKIDSEVELSDITWKFHSLLDQFEPFGEQNPQPRFLASGVTVQRADVVGRDGKHLRMQIAKNGAQQKTIGFGFGDWATKLKLGDTINVCFTLSVNEWNGNKELQLKIVDLRMSED